MQSFALGFLYEKSHTLFRLWAPSAEEVYLRLYEQGDGDCLRVELSVFLSAGRDVTRPAPAAGFLPKDVCLFLLLSGIRIDSACFPVFLGSGGLLMICVGILLSSMSKMPVISGRSLLRSFAIPLSSVCGYHVLFYIIHHINKKGREKKKKFDKK